jgi:hypothetical protein
MFYGSANKVEHGLERHERDWTIFVVINECYSNREV